MDFLEAFVGSLGFSQKCLRDWKHFFEFLNIVGESAEIAEAWIGEKKFQNYGLNLDQWSAAQEANKKSSKKN